MSDPQLPTSYDELLAKYKQLLEENSTLKNLVNSSRSENALVTREDQSVTILDVSAPLGTVEPVPTSPHPFLLEPILRHLSVFLDYASLHACRQVCSSWYIFMTTAFLKRSKIVMQFNRDVRPVPQRRLPRTPIPGPLQPPQQEDALWLDSSDSDEEFLHGWRTIDNLGKVYPYPIVTEAELALKEITRPEGSSTFRQLRKFYWESKARLCSSQSELIPSKINATEEEEDTNEDAILSFDLGLNFDKDLHIPSPPVPETLELVGFNCPSGWLKTYGYLVKNLSIDFGNFQRRERFGEVEPSVLVRLLKEFCPNVDSLVVQKPTYNLGQSLVRGEDGGPSQDVLLPVLPAVNLMATARFENISTLYINTYRSDRAQCVAELIGATPNVKHLTLSMFSLSPEAETQYVESAHHAGYFQHLETLKFPQGIKSTTLLFLVGIEFTRLKVLALGKIRQTRWVRGPNQAPGQLMALVDPGTLAEFMQTISSTLEDLSLNVNLSNPNEIGVTLNATSLPVMPYLHRFEFKYTQHEFTDSFAFLDNLPTLTDLNLSGEGTNCDIIIKKLLPDRFYGVNDSLTCLKLTNFPVDFPSMTKLVRTFPRLVVLHVVLPLCSSDPGNTNVRRPLSRYLFKLRKLTKLEELRILCSIVERDDFSYSIGFCLRYMRALKQFAFHSLKTVPRLTAFAVDMGFGKAPALLSVELEDFMIYEEDKAQIEASLKKKLLHAKLINCLIVSPLKNMDPPTSQRYQDASFFRREVDSTEKWSFVVQKYTDFTSLGQPRSLSDTGPFSSLSFSTSDTESLEFAIASF